MKTEWNVNVRHSRYPNRGKRKEREGKEKKVPEPVVLVKVSSDPSWLPLKKKWFIVPLTTKE